MKVCRTRIALSVALTLLLLPVHATAQDADEHQSWTVPVLALRALNLYGQNRLFGIGPDVTMAIFQRGGTIGLINAR